MTVDEGVQVGRLKPASDLRPMIASGGVRALLLPVSAVLTLGTSSILVRSVGATAYGAVIFIGTLFQLLPFADLGVAAAVTRAVAASDDPAHDPYVAAVLRRCLRVMSMGAAIALIALIIGSFGAWGPLLGLDGQVKHANAAATATIASFGLALPLALGQRVLPGSGKNHLSIAAGIVQPTTALVLSAILWGAGAPAGAFVLIYPIGLVVSSTTTTLLAGRLTGLHISPLAAIASLPPGAPAHPQAQIMNIAVPMFVLSIGLPIGLQCDKFVISHRRPPRALSEYALCSQLYVPSWLVLTAAASALLPVFTRRRARGLPHLQLWSRLTVAFAASSLVLGLVFTLAAPFVARLIASGRVHIGLDLRMAFGALLVVQTTGLVSAMVLNRPNEMRVQAYFVVAMMISNVVLSWVLAGRVGVAGPVIASAVTVGLLMTIPSGIRAARSREFSPTAAGLPVSLG